MFVPPYVTDVVMSVPNGWVNVNTNAAWADAPPVWFHVNDAADAFPDVPVCDSVEVSIPTAKLAGV
jgi:hypothetical protein